MRGDESQTAHEVQVKEPKLTTRDGFEFWWNVIFKFSDVVFKFVSWLLIIVGLRVAHIATGNTWVGAAVILSQILYVAAAMISVFFLLSMSPKKLGFLHPYTVPVKIAMFTIGLSASVVLTSPLMIVDNMIKLLVDYGRSRGGM